MMKLFQEKSEIKMFVKIFLVLPLLLAVVLPLCAGWVAGWMRPRTGGRGRIRVGRSGDAGGARDWQAEAAADNLDETDYGDYDEAEMLRNMVEKVLV